MKRSALRGGDPPRDPPRPTPMARHANQIRGCGTLSWAPTLPLNDFGAMSEMRLQAMRSRS
jgi:hypothetical protein